MKNTPLILLLAACIWAVSTPDTHARGGNLDSPLLIIPKPTHRGERNDLSFKPASENQIHLFKSFQEPFVSGYYINWNSWLHFTGDDGTLNRMFAELARIDGVKYGIRFTKRPIPAKSPFAGTAKFENLKSQHAAWTVHHDGQSNDIWITILVGKGGIDLEKLQLPTSIKSVP